MFSEERWDLSIRCKPLVSTGKYIFLSRKETPTSNLIPAANSLIFREFTCFLDCKSGYIKFYLKN